MAISLSGSAPEEPEESEEEAGPVEPWAVYSLAISWAHLS